MKLFYVKQKSTGFILTSYERTENISEMQLEGEYGQPFFHYDWYLEQLIQGELHRADMLFMEFSHDLKEAIDNKDLIVCEVEL